jgi:hypothetical protein
MGGDEALDLAERAHFTFRKGLGLGMGLLLINGWME